MLIIIVIIHWEFTYIVLGHWSTGSNLYFDTLMIYVSLCTFKRNLAIGNLPCSSLQNNLKHYRNNFLPVFLVSLNFSEVHTQAQIGKHVRRFTKGHSTNEFELQKPNAASRQYPTLLTCSVVVIWVYSRNLVDFQRILFELEIVTEYRTLQFNHWWSRCMVDNFLKLLLTPTNVTIVLFSLDMCLLIS